MYSFFTVKYNDNWKLRCVAEPINDIELTYYTAIFILVTTSKCIKVHISLKLLISM